MLFRFRVSLVMIESIQCMQFHLYMYLSNLIEVHSCAAENSSLNLFRYAEAGEVGKNPSPTLQSRIPSAAVVKCNSLLGGGFICFWFSPLLGIMIQFDYILFFKWVLQPLEPPPSSNPLCPGLPWIHRTRLCRGIHPTVWHRRPAAPYGHHHPRNRQWSQHRGPSILSYCDTWPFEKSDFQFWIPRLDTSISFLLKTKLSPWKNRTRDVFVKNLEFPEVQCWCVWPWAQRWPIWHFEIGQSLLWNLCCHQWLIGCSFMLDSEWWFTNHSGERSTLGESISPGDLFGFDDWSFSHRSYAEETLVTEGKSFGG